MGQYNRRNLFAHGSAIFAGLLATTALAGCAGSSTPVVNPVSGSTVSVSVFATDLQYINNGVKAILAVPALVALIPASDQFTISGYQKSIDNVLSEVAGADATITLSTGQGWVSTVTTNVNAILALVGKLTTIPSSVTTLIEAIESLIPIVETAVSLKAAASARRYGLTPQQARKILATA